LGTLAERGVAAKIDRSRRDTEMDQCGPGELR
jgi:hypothetical protein